MLNQFGWSGINQRRLGRAASMLLLNGSFDRSRERQNGANAPVLQSTVSALVIRLAVA